MAKRKGGEGNKSEEIRQILEANPDAKPRDIVKDLAAKGTKVTAQFVSTIKTKFKAQGGRVVGPDGGPPRRGRPPGKSSAKAKAMTTSSSGGGLTVQGLLQVKELVNKLGGLSKAKEALAALEQIVS